MESPWKNPKFAYQNRQHIVGRLALHIDAVHLNHLVADVNQSRPIGRSAVHDARNDDFARFLVRLDCGALQTPPRVINNVLQNLMLSIYIYDNDINNLYFFRFQRSKDIIVH